MHRILFVDEKDFFGGGQVFLVNLVSSLDPRRFTSFVVSAPNRYLAASLSRRQISHRELPFGRIQKSWNPLIILMNMSRQVIPTLRLIVLIRRWNIDIVCANDVYSYLSSFWAARLTRKPMVLVVHMSKYPKSFFTRFILRGADAIVAVTQTVFEILAEIEPSSTLRAHVIHNGVDESLGESSVSESGALRKEWMTDSEAVVVGTIGRLSQEKGVDILIRSAVEVLRARANVKIVIVGDGPEAGALRALAAGLGIDSSIVFTGFREDIPAILHAVDIMVIPSSAEGLPLILLEAMSAGKPVIATAVGGIPDVVEDGVNAILVPSSDPTALASAIVSLIDDSERRSSLGRCGRATIKEKLTLRRMATDYERVFMKVISGMQGPSQ